MAVVFRALDERLGRLVALKVLMPALAADEAFRHRFIRESRSAAAVDDPHIIPVFEAGEADGILFIAMRYVPDGDVGSLVRRQGPLSAARAAAIVSAIASALDAAHGAGLVHRDVKPGNMLIDARPGRPDHVYLSDFGLTIGARSSTGLTSAGSFLGTLDYCAPEQIQGLRADARTDEYALACATFVLLSGKPPFPRDEGPAVMYAQLSELPPRLADRQPGIPEAVDDVLLRALAKTPGDRYPSCGEFADALRLALGLEHYGRDLGLSPVPGHPLTEVARTGGPRELPAEPGTVTVSRQAPASTLDSGSPQPSGKGRRRAGVVALGAAAILALGGVAAALILAGAGHNADQAAGSSHPGSSSGAAARPALAAASSNPAARTSTRVTRSTGATPGTHTSPAAGDSPNTGTASQPIVRTFSDSGNGIAHVNSVAFSPDGKTLVTGDTDGAAYLWAVGTGRLITVLRGGNGAKVFAVAFSADGTLVATGYGNGSVALWNAASGQLVDTIRDPGGKAVNAVAFSPVSMVLVTGDENGSAYIWNVGSGGRAVAVARTVADPSGAGVWSLAFSPDGKTLATGDYDGSAYLWGTSGTPVNSITIPGGHEVTALAYSTDGQTIAIGYSGGSAYLWEPAAGTRTTIPEPATVWAVAISENGLLAVGDGDGSTYLRDAATGDDARTLTDPASGTEGVGAVAFSPGGQLLATGDTNGTTYLWRVG